ncbi:MAG: class I SAM-dependent methyltransferase [Acidimicrobiales bacterium]
MHGAGAGSGAADALYEAATGLFGGPPTVRVRAWDGSSAGPEDAPATIEVGRRALRHMLWAPGELGLARAYVSGDLDVEGDLLTAVKSLAPRTAGAISPQQVRGAAHLLRVAGQLGGWGPRPPVPPEEAHISRRHRVHSRERDSKAVRHHYDVSNAFYRLVLGETMVYSCAYWPEPPSESFTIDMAQEAKLELVCRKLDLQPGMRLLDVGCGWGGLVLHAARHHGVDAVGVTLSPEQAALARERVTSAGAGGRVEIRVQDYRDIDDGPYDAVASVGMVEHVGRDHLAEYAGAVRSVLAPRGRVLNHAIARRPHGQSGRSRFISSYIFPDGDLVPLATMVEALEGAGLEVRDVEALREHYAKTLTAWHSNLTARWQKAVELVGTRRARAWKLYFACCAAAFEIDRLGVNQILAVRTPPGSVSGMPPTRGWLAP